jgi:hypothetical protein
MSKAILTLDQVRNYCVFDGKPIPAERVKRNAVTCSKECAKAIERQRMLLMEQTECKYCRRPSTPEERESYKQWRKWLKDQATAEATTEAVAEVTETIAEEVTEKITEKATELTEYPYVYTRWNSAKKGQRCRTLLTGYENNATHVQIQFEDGETLIADKMNLSSGLPKRYREKRGKPRRSESTLAAKQQIDEGE